MGCASSKKAVSVTPAVDSSGILRENNGSNAVPACFRRTGDESGLQRKGEESRCVSTKSASSVSTRLRNLHNYIEAEQVAAGWPAWLSAVAGEAIQGLVPLKSDSFEKLEKIGQGTYSSVFRARDLDTGKTVALKKVRFDNFEPESVRFMAREIQILRNLDHPNVVKLEGLITSQLSCSLYLVFEYMDHDLAGLSSCPDIKFTESQVKCYMHQLLSGLEHCHSRGIIHRDIKGANLLVNNDGILKIADFGLANFCRPVHKQPLTSRVVTLWYRPPELLFGSTDYEASVDLWSVGCLFAELFLKKPILQGRTEVEQLHKIFKLCGSPADEYWKKSKLPHATIFKPHRPYESCLYETFKTFPASAFNLLETLLSVEPYRRGTASSALTSEYFMTKPSACEPSSLPKYPPTKEIDMKNRDSRKRAARVASRGNEQEATRRSSKAYGNPQEAKGLNRLLAQPEESETNTHEVNGSGNLDKSTLKGDNRLFVGQQPMTSIDPPDDGQHMKDASRRDVPFSGPLHVSSGFGWVKKTKEDRPLDRSHNRSRSRRHVSSGAIDPSRILQAKNILKLNGQAIAHAANEACADSKGHESYEIAKQAMLKNASRRDIPFSGHPDDGQHMKDASRRDVPFSGSLHVSSGFGWVKKTKEDRPLDRLHNRSRSRRHVSSGAIDPSSILQAKNILKLNGQAIAHAANEACADSKGHKSYEIAKQAMLKKWAQLEYPDSFNFSDLYHSQEFKKGNCIDVDVSSNRSMMNYQDQAERVEFSGPLLSQAHKVDELLQKHERHIRRAVRRSWFQRGRK